MLKKTKAAVIAGMLAFGASMSVSTPTTYAMIDEESCCIDELYVGMDIDEVIEIYGQPSRVNRESDNHIYYYDRHDLHLYVSNGMVFIVDVWAGSDLVTEDGWEIGDSIRDVVAEYGRPDRTYKDSQGVNWYVYRGEESELQFKLSMDGKTIAGFRLRYDQGR